MGSSTMAFSVSLSTLVKRHHQHHRSSHLSTLAPRRCFQVSSSASHPTVALPADFTPKQLLEAVSRESDESSALRVYEWASKQPNFRPSPALFHELLRKLARSGSLESMRSVLHEIPPEMVSESTFLIFADALASFDLHEEIVLLLDAMESDFGVKAGARFHNHVLNALVESNKLRLVEQAHSRMVRAGVAPDLSTFNVLIKALCRAHQIRPAMLMLEEMSTPGHGISPDETTFATIMQGFVEEGNVDGALRMRERMVSEYGCRGSNVTVNVLVNGLCRAGRVGEALGLVRDTEGFRPDIFTYNTLVNGLAQSGHVGDAIEVVDVMLQEGFDPDIYTYNSLISGHCKAGEIGEAMGILTEMVARNIRPDTVTYNTLIAAMCRERRVKEATELVRAVSGKGVMAADSVTFNSLIQGLCLSGDHAGAEEMLSEMRSKGCDPDEFTYSMLIDSSCSKGRVREAMRLLEEMEASGCPRNSVVYNTLIDGLCKNERVAEAEEVFDEMEVRGVSRDAVTYNTLISGLCRAGRVGDATQLMDQMMMEGLAPDKFTFTSLLSFFCRAGDMKRATDIVQSMGASGCEPDIVTYGTLVAGLCRAGRVDVATRLLRSLHIKGLTLTPKAYNPAVQALFKRRRNAEAIRLFREMAAKGHPPPDAVSHNIVFRGLCQGGGPIAEPVDFAFEMMGKGFVPDFPSFEMLADGLCSLSMEDTLAALLLRLADTAALAPAELSAVRGYVKIRKFHDALRTLGGALYKRRPRHKYPYKLN